MVVGAKVCELTDGFLWFVCGLYMGILTSPLSFITRLCYKPVEKTALSGTGSVLSGRTMYPQT